jgi:hypothetical protein
LQREAPQSSPRMLKEKLVSERLILSMSHLVRTSKIAYIGEVQLMDTS